MSHKSTNNVGTHENAEIILARGLKARQQKKNEEAAAAFEELLKIAPDRFDAQANLANTYRDMGRPSDALVIYDNLLTKNSHVAALFYNKAVALRMLDQLPGALECLKRALALNPKFAAAECERGGVLHALKDIAKAEIAYDRAIFLEPKNSHYFNKRGNFFATIGAFHKALSDYSKALEISGMLIEPLNNRANLYRDLGRFEDALSDYDHALKINPGSVEVMINRANVLRDLGRHYEALGALDHAIRLNEAIPQAYLHRGKIYSDLGCPLKALNNFDLAIERKEEFWEAWFYKGATLREMGDHQGSLHCFSKINEDNQIEANLAAIGNHLFSLNHTAHLTPSECLVYANDFGSICRKLAKTIYTDYPHLSHTSKIRVGLVSGDFERHPVGYFLKNVLPYLSGDKIELHAFSNSSTDDDLTQELKNSFFAWHDVVHETAQQLAARIWAAGINILVDLSGHTNKSRLTSFAYKPAPLQVSWLGYCASTGLTEIDYIIGDRIVTPASEADHFVEKIWQLPDVYICFSEPDKDVPIGPLPALINGFITFGSFNKLSKLTDDVAEVWASVLKDVPGSRLMLKSPLLKDTETCSYIKQRFFRHGVDPQRLILEGASDYKTYLESYNKIDVMLDPFPYPGATTTLEGLWMGVPFVTMKGDRFLSRNGELIALHAGLSECISGDRIDYIRNAKRLASDLNELASLRTALRSRIVSSPLFNGRQFAQNLEDAFLSMWEQYRL
jgi:protein O-GlcNAc transferase